MFDGLKDLAGKMKNSLMDATLKGIMGNPDSCRKMANDITKQIAGNLIRLNCDAAKIELFEGGKSLGIKQGYGAFPIDRNELLVFGFIPKGVLTFERIKSFLPESEVSEKKVVLLVGINFGILEIVAIDFETQEKILSEGVEDFIFRSLYHSPEEREDIKNEFLQAVGGDNMEAFFIADSSEPPEQPEEALFPEVAPPEVAPVEDAAPPPEA